MAEDGWTKKQLGLKLPFHNGINLTHKGRVIMAPAPRKGPILQYCHVGNHISTQILEGTNLKTIAVTFLNIELKDMIQLEDTYFWNPLQKLTDKICDKKVINIPSNILI